ncbi:unnamed protein product [Urochloa decumbens]
MFEPAMKKPRLTIVHLLHLALFLLAMLLLHPYVLLAITPTPSSSLAAGESLSPPNYITSPSGYFAFGFRALDNNSNSFLLAIWFHFDPCSVVWFATHASSGSAVVAAGQSVLNLTAAGQLSLLPAANPSNATWSPYTDPSQNYGSLLALRDTGNLQFLGADGKTVVWESFGHPTDTLLPGQVMPPNSHLQSRASDADFSVGGFLFYVQGDGNIVMYRATISPGGGGSPYWATNTNCAGCGNTTLFFDAELIGRLYYRLTDGSSRNLTSPQPGNRFFYQHATLDPDGILRVYILSNNTAGNGNATWSVMSSTPSLGCQTRTHDGDGLCGHNSYCVVYGADNRLDCECLSGYTFLDTQFRYNGCSPAFLPETCDDGNKSHASEFKLVELTNTYWPTDIKFYEQHLSITAEQCQDLCLHNCPCAAALFDGSSNSCFEAATLTTGWQQNGTSMRTLVKVRIKGRSPAVILPYSVNGNVNGNGRKTVLIVLISVPASLLLPCIYVFVWHRQKLRFFLCKKTSSTIQENIEALILAHGSLAPKRYNYSEVTKMTSSLNNKLGEGGYGMVFKGRLDDGRLVAVKFLHDSKGDGEEFVNEVMSIGRTSHINIVSLFGFCLEGSKRALIYEYMPNGSLDKYIYSENPKETLGWDRLYNIAIGIARGLEYLHHSCNTRIVHFDIKPQNILLDQNFHPKIAGFGLAKLCHTKESKLSLTGARGTPGFIAPEVHSRTFGVVSAKSDVYSYGMMLLEMVGGRKNIKSMAQESSEKYFPHWIYDHFGQDGLQACEVTHENEGIARKISVIGLWCIQILPMHRPTIGKVLEMFERGTDELDMPPRQNFSQIFYDPANSLNAESTSMISGTTRQVSSEVLNMKEISVVNSKILRRLPTL